MEELSLQEPVCSQCATLIKQQAKFCTHCGYPQLGTEKEQSQFHAKRVMAKQQQEVDVKRIASAQKTLYWTSGIFMVFGLFYFFKTEEISILITNAILSILYLLLAFWTKEKPFAALLSALLLYLTVIAINAVIEPMSLLSGIIMKVVFLTLLIKGLYSASQRTSTPTL
ncbi:hypothetical protein ACE939_11845 [Aquimarina sp. W85]|uniref:zinc ribbon domain-containing protein n=1 Tax=Aquimarina rhodophyticola TaxID=3342246 RepID=UPI0036725C8F